MKRILLASAAWCLCTGLIHAALTDELVVHLPFDGVYTDLSGRGNNGFPQGEPTFATGKLGSAVFVSNDAEGSFANYVSLSDVAAAVTGPDMLMGDATDFTIAMWVQVNDFTGDPALVSNKDWDGGGNPGFVLGTNTDRRVEWNWKESICTRKDYDGPGGSLTAGGWHHLAMAIEKRDGMETALRTYLDGQLVNTTSLRNNPCEPSSIDTNDIGLSFNIGTDGTGLYASQANTGIDDFGLWRRALSTFEIGRIFSFGQAGTNISAIPEPTLAAVEATTPPKNSTTVAPDVICEVRLKDAGTAIVVATAKATFDGVAVTPVVTKTADVTSISYDPPGMLASKSAHTFAVEIKDNADPANVITEVVPFTVAEYLDITLPAPIYRETFDSLEEGALPAGWEVTHFTDGESGFSELSDFRSDAYLNWVVVNISRQAEWVTGGDYAAITNVAPNQFVNGAAVTTLLENNFLFAASTDRSGNQVQYVTTHDIALGRAGGINLLLHSAYTQNQDSLFAVEYSVDQGVSWLPALYCLDAGDIVAEDAIATFTTPRTDIPAILTDPDGNVLEATYGDFVRAPVNEAIGAFISPRVDDNQTESKRVEFLRLAGADGQDRVRLRFVNVGTNSWYSGIDNINLYSLSAAPVDPIVLTAVAAVGNDVKLDWTGGRAPFQVQRSLSMATGSWINAETTSNRTITVAPGAATVFYRVISAP